MEVGRRAERDADEREPVCTRVEDGLVALREEGRAAGCERIAGERAAALEREQEHVVAGVA